ncbi:hypothetical protein GCM10011576_41190 [Micromonospora parathelypteridis]|nr:hypothetical protein GCM10011576_41190 [Micromonospora parathelypteridis]
MGSPIRSPCRYLWWGTPTEPDAADVAASPVVLPGEAGLANTGRGRTIGKLNEERGDHQDGVRGLEPLAAVVAPRPAY